MGGNVDLSHLLELAWQGFVFLSPVPSDELPNAISFHPDPLPDRHWDTLRLLSDGLNQKEVAYRLPGVGFDGVKTRVADIKNILYDAREIESKDLQDITDWYWQNHIRYRRFKNHVRK
ncbi:MAG: hypothetical protein DWQ04_03070 [Chloroflexi bacterium]|nr:MAG: hypothetical protein DWQ04_03070 [Chloroflexota bacterium]